MTRVLRVACLLRMARLLRMPCLLRMAWVVFPVSAEIGPRRTRLCFPVDLRPLGAAAERKPAARAGDRVPWVSGLDDVAAHAALCSMGATNPTFAHRLSIAPAARAIGACCADALSERCYYIWLAAGPDQALVPRVVRAVPGRGGRPARRERGRSGPYRAQHHRPPQPGADPAFPGTPAQSLVTDCSSE